MEKTPKRYHYVYYSYEEWGRGYIGSRTCKCLPEEDVKYFGSYTDKTFKPTHKIILNSDYKTREDCLADEVILHKFYDVSNNPHFANKACQTSSKFYLSTEKAIENGKKIGFLTLKLKVGVHGRTKEQMSLDSKKAGKSCYRNKSGIFSMTEEERKKASIKGGKIAGNTAKELKIGICGMSFEQLSELGKKNGPIGGKIGGKITKELKIGIHGLTEEQKSENGRKGGNKSKELGVGIFSLPKETFSKNGKRLKQLGLGIFGMSEEEKMEVRRKQKENKAGIYGMTREQRTEIGNKNRDLRRGICGLTKEQRQENVKITNSQKWMCLETGFITTPGPLSRYQKKRGIDTNKRIKVE